MLTVTKIELGLISLGKISTHPTTPPFITFTSIITICVSEFLSCSLSTIPYKHFMRYLYRLMMTSSNGNIFRVTGPLWGEFTGHRWILPTKASGAELWCFFDLRLNKRLSKQSIHRWFETPSRPLWPHCSVIRCHLTNRVARSCELSR